MPIDTLPVEILIIIFLLVRGERPPALSPWSKCYPFVLASVSPYWRTVALSSPVLWSQVVVQRPGHLLDRQRIADRVQTQITRSAPASFEFVIELEDGEGPHQLRPIWAVVASQFHRCRSLRFRGLTELIDGIVLPLPSLDQLDKLQLLRDPWNPFGALPSLPRGHALPKLTSMQLGGVALSPGLAFPRLRSLRLAGALGARPQTLVETFRTLKQCTGLSLLENLELVGFQSAHPDPYPIDETPLSLPALISLHMPACPTERLISAPQLRTLVRRTRGFPTSPCPISFQTIEQLALISPSPQDTPNTLLASKDSVNSLVLLRVDPAYIEDFLEALTSPQTSSGFSLHLQPRPLLAPCLETLEIWSRDRHFWSNVIRGAGARRISLLCALLDARPDLRIGLPHEELADLRGRADTSRYNARLRGLDGDAASRIAELEFS